MLPDLSTPNGQFPKGNKNSEDYVFLLKQGQIPLFVQKRFLT